MKSESRVFLFLVIFFAIVTPLYVVMTWQLDGFVEPIGTTALGLTFLFSLMIWGALAFTGRTFDPRPEDRHDAEVIDGTGTMGFFPPKSLVPFWSTVAITVILLGPVFGWWISILGAGIGIWAVLGWAYEYYVGDYKH